MVTGFNDIVLELCKGMEGEGNQQLKYARPYINGGPRALEILPLAYSHPEEAKYMKMGRVQNESLIALTEKHF